MLELQTFGGLALRTGAGERVEGLAGRTKCLALLAYLAAEAPEGRVPREEMAARLWPAGTDERARASLRKALSEIRQATEADLVAGAGTSTVGLARDHIRADVIAFRDALEAGEKRRALELYEGDFLAGVHVKGAGRFQRWVDRTRGQLRQQAYEAALSVGASAREAGELASAEDAFRQALDLAPLREEAAEKLIQTLAERGRTADAVQLYEAFRQRRQEELEMAPSEELQERVAELKQAPPAASAGGESGGKAEPTAEDAAAEPAKASGGEPEGPPDPKSGGPSGREPSRWGRFRRRTLLGAIVAAGLLSAAVAGAWHLLGPGGEAATPAAGDRSVAVLPFETIGTEEPGPIAEGLHNDLLTRLSNVSGLDVISATSVERFRDTDLPLPAIADSLGVTWVVEGEVQRADDAIQVNAQLVDPRTDTHAWADSYRRELTAQNLFAVQNEISRAIAAALETRLAPAEAQRLARQPTQDLDAYRFYLQGRGLLEQWTPQNRYRALDYFDQAIARDSNYALAWAGRADALTELILWRSTLTQTEPDTILPQAASAARRALALDPGLAEGHAALGRLEIYRRNAPAAFRRLRQSIEIKPSYATAHSTLALLQLVMGRAGEALPNAERGVELDPLSPKNQATLFWASLANGDPERALRVGRRIHQLRPEVTSNRLPERIALFHLRREDKLRALVRKQGRSASEAIFLALIEAESGNPAPAERILRNLQEKEEVQTTAPVLLNAVLGQKEAAFDALRKAVFDEHPGLTKMLSLRNLWPKLLGPIRDDPRYDQFIEEVNTHWGLEPDGSLPDSVSEQSG